MEASFQTYTEPCKRPKQDFQLSKNPKAEEGLALKSNTGFAAMCGIG